MLSQIKSPIRVHINGARAVYIAIQSTLLELRSLMSDSEGEIFDLPKDV